MSFEITLIISIISVSLSAFSVIKSTKRTDVKDIEERAREDARINCKLDEVISVTRDLRKEIIDLKNEINNHNNRIIKIEESIKNAYHRIDGIERRLNIKEEE